MRGEESTGGTGNSGATSGAGGGGGAGGAGEEGKQPTGDVSSGTCACKEDARPTRFSSVAEEARIESINFENALQNHVSYYEAFYIHFI